MATHAREIPPVRATVSHRHAARPVAVATWLFCVALLVVVMVAVGGITRLTESGLSITEWKPVTGALPPLSTAQWQAEFDLYKQIPEYRNVTGPAGMDLAAFKFIYFWEWFHRLLGRVIGLAFAVPLAWFWIKGQIPAGYKGRLVALLALGGLQGVFGWFMVHSGLSGRDDRCQPFLAVDPSADRIVHVGRADLDRARSAARWRRMRARSRLTGFAGIVAAVLFVQLLLGAWVAGLNAGLVSDSWPLMQDRLVPEYDSRERVVLGADA